MEKRNFVYGWICSHSTKCSLVRTNEGDFVRANPRPDLNCSTPVRCQITGDEKSRIAIIVASEALPEIKPEGERPNAYIHISAIAFAEGEPTAWRAGAVAGYMAAFSVDRMGYTPVLCVEAGVRFEAACALHGPSARAMSAVRGWMSKRWQTMIIPSGEDGVRELAAVCEEDGTSMLILPQGIQLPHNSNLGYRLDHVHVEHGALCFDRMRRIEPLPLPLFTADVSDVA